MNASVLTGLIAALGKAGLTGISGAATTYSTSATTLVYAFKGKCYSKAQVSGGTTPTTDIKTGVTIPGLVANQGRIVVWGLDTSGNVRVVAGAIVALDTAGNFVSPGPVFPDIPDNFCPFAYTVHKAGSTTVGTWLFGTSNWNATGLTHSVQDVAGGMPDRPQQS